MVAIPFPLSSLPGPSGPEGQGRLVNAFAEREGERILWRRSPGSESFRDTGRQDPRGFLDVNGTLYAAFRDTVVTIGADGAVTALTGRISGAGPVTMARNNKVPDPDVVCVFENGVAVADRVSLSTYPDGDLPQPNSVSFLDGFFLFTVADGRIFASDLNGTAVDALSFAKAEAKPDGLSRGIVSGSYFYGFGTASFERWRNVGTQPFPLARDAVVPVGLAGPWAVAGFEDGWDGLPILVAADNTVRAIAGTDPQVISTRHVERLIAAVDDRTKLTACVYGAGGHAFWSLSGPDWTVEFNTTTRAWNERRSHGAARWRCGPTVKAFGRWLAGDLRSSRLLAIDGALQSEAGEPLGVVIESAPVMAFPARVAVTAAHFDFVTAVGDARGVAPVETDPTVAISWSHDGGATWGAPVFRSLGRQGETRTRIRINRLGLTTHRGIRFRLAISDPVRVALLGGEVEAAARTP
jgi:hypothetical protein